MQISFLIVTKNRAEALAFTLNKLKLILDLSIHEVLVGVDGCKETEAIIQDFNWVNWTVIEESISASPARNLLYKKAIGEIFIGLDDDAHPISTDFIKRIEKSYSENENLGIIAFQEVRGIFKSDTEALEQSQSREAYLTNDFVGCGFSIKKAVYNKTEGFPVWIDIYGEEPALALEVLNLDYTILYEPEIKVNHRVDVEKRKLQGRNYFRFEKQLQNTLRYFLVYYPNPILSILKALLHNFKKYAIVDWNYFKSFIKVCFLIIFKLPKILKYRKPVKKDIIKLKQELKPLNYSA